MDEFKAQADKYIAEGKVGPGVVAVTYTTENGGTTSTMSSGHEAVGSEPKAISPESIFRLASCTKLITTVAVLKFVSENGVDLDDPEIVENHLPGLCRQEVLSDHSPPLAYKKRTNLITLRYLLSHTSGSSLDMIEPLLSWRSQRGEYPLSLTGLLPEAYETPLLFEPGEGWGYGAGQDWAAVIIEKITGSRFSAYLKEHVFDVLGMDGKIGFWKDKIEETAQEEIVMIRERDESGALRDKAMPQFNGENAGGGLMCSVENYVRVLKDLVSPTSKLLGPGMLRELFAPQMTVGSTAHEYFAASSVGFKSMTGPFTSDLDATTALNHSLGRVIIQSGELKGTMCWGGAFNWVWYINRDAGLAGVYAGAMWPPAEEKSVELQHSFIENYRRAMKGLT